MGGGTGAGTAFNLSFLPEGHPPGGPQAWAAPSATAPSPLRGFRPSEELAMDQLPGWADLMHPMYPHFSQG